MFRIFQGISGREKESVWHIVPYHIITPVCQDQKCQTKRKEYQVMADKSVAIAVPPRLPWDWTVVNKSGMALSRVLHQQTGILCVIHISTTDSSVNNTMPSNKFLAVILRKNPKKNYFLDKCPQQLHFLCFLKKNILKISTQSMRYEGMKLGPIVPMLQCLSSQKWWKWPSLQGPIDCIVFFPCHLTQSPLCSWWL